MTTPASSSPSASASASASSPPIDAPLPEENSSTTPQESSSSDRSRKLIIYASIFASLVACGWYLNKGISASINYHKIRQEFGSWDQSWALVTGRNKTYPGIKSVGPFLPFFTDDPFYCALMTYETGNGEKVTATSLTNCGDLPTEVVIGEEFEILYNPGNTREFLEKEIIDDSLSALIGATAIVFVFALGFLGCAVFLWRKRDVAIGLERNAHRRRPGVPRRGRDDEEVGIELTSEEMERRKRDREEKIMKYFRFETVSENGADASFAPSLTKSASEDGSHTTEPSTSTEETSQLPYGSHGDECCICMEKYCQGEHICTPMTTDDCKHVFHKACLLEWLQRHDHCPLCRVNLVQDK
ncbi:unnamed protein product [Cylindrotheca closterium]|uniref:RING-type domain-containing protein n=1 Tax=Cylindrotheca closterium TaxID=2856 RepID=A0AAD2JI50_9STRA|nr:unnamed protein product [Cylindrotheca closterium]